MNGERFAKEIIADDTYIAVGFRIEKYVVVVTIVEAGCMGCIAVRLLHAPKPAAAPGVEGSMIMGLADGVVNIIELDDMAASPTIVHTNGRARQVVDHVMANYVLLADGKENACDCLPKIPQS